DDDLLIFQIYVIDIIFGAINPSLCKKFSELMQSKFETNMMGEIKFFLGLQIKLTHEWDCYTSKYTKELSKKFNMQGANQKLY
ncbi:hypothetical protein J0J28_23475, partial [Vibrio vulnificus]